MRIPAISFLFLALSLPALAHHDRDEREYRHGWGHRRAVMEDCGPRFYRERPLTPPWAYRPRVVVHEPHRWCESEWHPAFVPPPPVIVRPHARIWIGF